ncbi:hypothetical protein LV779_34165 [Streptomyces thinghirensis]|nr:hypothetical protein [Streptomyces thinghirensis]
MCSRAGLATAFYDRLLAHTERLPGLPVEQRPTHFLRTVGLHLALSHAILSHQFGQMATAEQRERLYALVAELLEDGRQAGVLAPDVTLSDVAAAVWALRGIIETTDPIAPGCLGTTPRSSSWPACKALASPSGVPHSTQNSWIE